MQDQNAIVSKKMNNSKEVTVAKSCEDHSDLDEPPLLSGFQGILESLVPQSFESLTIIKNAKLSTPSSSPRTTLFRKSQYPHISKVLWNDWKWQLQNRITTLDELALILRLSKEENKALKNSKQMLPFSVTPYYASLLDRDDPQHPLRRTVIPVTAECKVSYGEADDPLHEDGDSPVPGLVHRYPDRVLFLVTDFCSTYCRYCTRSRMVGRSLSRTINGRNWETAVSYIASHREVRDVLISGGDPLTLADDALKWLLSSLRRIPHVEIIRIGSKVPAVLPQRINRQLVSMLKRHHPLWMNLHFTHPDEITPETETALRKLSDAGIPLGCQTVLLKGINDSVDTLRSLYHKLLKCRVRPYYLYQCDPISGSSHFRTSVKKGLSTIKGLRGFTTGFAVPNYVIDAPGGGGKIPLQPQYYKGREGTDIVLTNFEDKIYKYPDTSIE